MLGRGHPWPHRLLKENLKGMGCSPCLGFGFGMLACSLLPVCTAAGRLVAELSLMFGWGGGVSHLWHHNDPDQEGPTQPPCCPSVPCKIPIPRGISAPQHFPGQAWEGQVLQEGTGCSRGSSWGGKGERDPTGTAAGPWPGSHFSNAV